MIQQALATGLLALGIVCLVEGLAWGLAPSLVERLLAALATMSEADRRKIGLLAMAAGVLLLWAAKTLGA
ncbi:DUF2065 domain-containing protein [Oceanicola sp. S124]|uniref:DUF2065 domain-containing protein n=1 Tax=Oceanicola sp. S124 TaxID=1042378 RepID=UPI0002557947|nr:DUF2065 domain-containing protein [Oceanicola sp. S124]